MSVPVPHMASEPADDGKENSTSRVEAWQKERSPGLRRAAPVGDENACSTRPDARATFRRYVESEHARPRPSPSRHSPIAGSAQTPPRRPLQVLQEREPLKRARPATPPSPQVPKKSRTATLANAGFVRSVEHIMVSPEPILDDDGSPVADDDRDPQMCKEYSDEILEYLERRQEVHMVDPAYIDAMPPAHRWRVNRHTLVNWMVTVHKKFKLVAETLYLGVNVVDRFLSRKPVPLSQVQVLGATALFIAAKFEEIMTPSVSNFAYVANATDESVREMEIDILVTLQFDLSYANPLNFLRRISKADDYDVRTRTVAKFLLEMQLFEPRLMVYRPSDVAAAAMHLAREILGLPPWSRNFTHYSGGCTSEGLAPITKIMSDYLAGPCEQRDPEFINKYMSKRNLQAASHAANWARE